MTVSVALSDEPGQDPQFTHIATCRDWQARSPSSTNDWGADVKPRAVPAGSDNVAIRIYALGGDSYRLVGPPPAPEE